MLSLNISNSVKLNYAMTLKVLKQLKHFSVESQEYINSIPSNKTGVYIFSLNDFPIYVGMSGSGKQHLRKRINHHLNPHNSDSSLRKKICKIDNLKDEMALDMLKKCSISVIICGSANCDDYKKSKLLEANLIGVLLPKYNF